MNPKDVNLQSDDSRRKLTSAESRKQPRTSDGFTSSYGVNRSKPSERHYPWLPRCDLSASPCSSRVWRQSRQWQICPHGKQASWCSSLPAFSHFSGAATCNLCDRLRGPAARLGLLAAGRAFRAALLNSGTTALVLGAALHALLAAAEPSVRFAAGALLFAAGELGRTAVLGLFVSGDGSGEQQTQGEERTGKQFRKHGMISSECRVNNQRSLRRR